MASEGNRHAKRKSLHTAATFGAANFNDWDGDTSAGHAWNQFLFLGDGVLGEVYYGISLRDIRIWARAVSVMDGLKVSDRSIK